MWHNKHYGLLLKNVTENVGIDFTVKFSKVINLELDGDEANNIF